MFPSREKAEQLLQEAEAMNPGPWGNHSRTAAHCAFCIASHCKDMDPDKAYVLGLLHDIGRRFGVRYLGHVSDGYKYMMQLGYDEVARVCMTHSFSDNTIRDYVGRHDVTPEEMTLIQTAIAEIERDDYYRLIQLCDAISGSEGVMDIEDRMNDVRRRYGSYSPAKWDQNIHLKRYFEQKMGMDLYKAVEKDTFHPGIESAVEGNE